MFKNFVAFRLSPAAVAALDALPDGLGAHRLRPCGPLEWTTTGFLPPPGLDEDELLRRCDGHLLVSYAKDTKILPPAVIGAAIAQRVKAIQSTEDRRVSARERRKIKELVADELLPRAFTRLSRSDVHVAKADGWLLVDTTSRGGAELAVSGLRDAVGSLPVLPLCPEVAPRQVLTEWLSTRSLPARLSLGSDCELRDPTTASGAKWRGSATDLESDEVAEHLRAGMQAYRLGLIYDQRLSFVLGEDLIVRKLRWLDTVTEDTAESSYESLRDEHDAQYTLMALELDRLLADLARWFGISRPADAA